MRRRKTVTAEPELVPGESPEETRHGHRMMDLVKTMPGFVSFKGCTTDDGETFAMATFESEEALGAWRNHPEHRATQRRGYEEFYDSLCGSRSVRSFASTNGHAERRSDCCCSASRS